jgi:hypothetical protein
LKFNLDIVQLLKFSKRESWSLPIRIIFFNPTNLI